MIYDQFLVATFFFLLPLAFASAQILDFDNNEVGKAPNEFSTALPLSKDFGHDHTEIAQDSEM